MRVAILGAGLSGLACAHQLERWGIEAQIFERTERVGKWFPENMEAILFAMHRPFRDPVKMIEEQYGLTVRPARAIERLILHGPSESATIEGHLGWFHFRGHLENSMELQLLSQLKKTRIQYESHPHPRELAGQFDRVVVATGSPVLTAELSTWENDTFVTLTGGPVLGDFQPEEAHVWVSTKLANRGYVFLLPYSRSKAALVCAVDTRDHSLARECLRRTQEHTGLSVPDEMAFTWDLSMGRTPRRQVDKFLFTGHAGGFIDPLAGFGQIPALLSGILAARSIAAGEDFERLTSWQRDHYGRMLRLRHRVDRWENRHFDRAIRLLRLRPVNWLAAKAPFNIIAALAGGAALADWAEER